VKLLLDENLSPRLLELLAADFPDSTHIERLRMRGVTDAAIWAYARNNGYTIVSKDNDFRQQAFLHSPPPKVVWLSVGNAGSDDHEGACMVVFFSLETLSRISAH